MKQLFLVSVFFMFCTLLFGQKVVLKPSTVAKQIFHDKSQPLRDIEPIPPKNDKINWEDGIINNNFDRRKYKKEYELKQNEKDPVAQEYFGTRQTQQTMINFEGIDKTGGGGATPPDTDGDVGPDHYFQMVNTAFQIFDKQGNSLYGPADNSTIFDGWDDGQPFDNHNDGDPIVLYDETADRWLVTHFALDWMSSQYYILLAVSETGDPMGSYYRYAFQFNDMPDYPKFGIWSDGYYMTLNSNTQNTVVFERDSMLVGAEARMVAFDLRDYPGGGFKSALAADCDATLPPAGSPNYIIYYNDDAWGTYPTDHLRIWEFKTDWVNTANSTLTLSPTLPTAAFDSQFDGGFSNITQPGSSQKIDAIMQAIMFRMQYRNFGTHESIVLNFVVDVNGADQAGIRWYELRKDVGDWYIYQEGTYAPDSDSRFIGSIAMDMYGNIGLAFSVSSNSVFPSLRYTGHTNNAPLGTMNIMEHEIITGEGSQEGTDRFGDYAMLSVDPTDNTTFWFTSEYIPASGDWKTRIASFVIDPSLIPGIDVAPQTFASPVSSTDLSATETVSLLIANYGNDTVYDIPVAFEFEGGAPVWDTVFGVLPPANIIQHTFTPTVDMSAEGIYHFKAYTALPGDTVADNDTLNMNIEHITPSYCYASGGSQYITISINNVHLNTINNNSTYTDYSDFTSTSTALSLTNSYPVSVAITPSGFGGEQVIVWIDWNQNLSFDDAGEKTILSASFTGTISVPANAVLGSTRMRVRLHSTFSPNGTPCGSSSLGEVEDYTIIVEDGLATTEVRPEDFNLTILPNPSGGEFNIQFDNLKMNLSLQIIDAVGKEVYRSEIDGNQEMFSEHLDLSDKAKGLYFVRIRTANTIIIAKKLLIVN